jgi:predicted naringenin-chalcone synthase
MNAIVPILLAVAAFSWIAGIVTHFLFTRALRKHGLKVPNVDDWSWARATYPPGVTRIRSWIWIWAFLFLGCVAAAAILTYVFDLCPGCKATGMAA